MKVLSATLFSLASLAPMWIGSSPSCFAAADDLAASSGGGGSFRGSVAHPPEGEEGGVVVPSPTQQGHRKLNDFSDTIFFHNTIETNNGQVYTLRLLDDESWLKGESGNYKDAKLQAYVNEWEQWEFEDLGTVNGNQKVYIRNAYHGTYLSARRGSDVETVQQASTWEEFVLIPYTNGEDGTQYFRIQSDEWGTTLNGRNGEVSHENNNSKNSWVIMPLLTVNIRNDNNGRYLYSVSGDNKTVNTTPTEASTTRFWIIFRWMASGANYVVQLKSASHYNYIRAMDDGNVKMDETHDGSKEMWEMILTGDNSNNIFRFRAIDWSSNYLSSDEDFDLYHSSNPDYDLWEVTED